MIRYKLTTQDMKTRAGLVNEVTWRVGEWREAAGQGSKLCSDGFIHWYPDPLLAVLLNPIHAAIENPRLWEVETEGAELIDREMKGGSIRVKLLREIPVPEVSMEHRIRFAVLCAKEVYKDTNWNMWADKWLIGEDRRADAAYAAAYAADAAYAAAADAAYAAADNDRKFDLVEIGKIAMSK